MASAHSGKPARNLAGRGFDLLCVVTLVTLVSLLLGPMGHTHCGGRSRVGVRLDQVRCALELYYSEFLAYPPDGYDEPGAGAPGIALGRWSDGRERRFKGSGCLVYFLCRPITKITIKGPVFGRRIPQRSLRREVVGPFLTELPPLSLSIEEYEEHGRFEGLAPEASRLELLDRHQRPIVYDRLDRDGRRSTPRLAGSAGLLERHWMAGAERLGQGWLPAEHRLSPGRPFGYELRSYGPSLADPRDDVVRSSFAPPVGP